MQPMAIHKALIATALGATCISFAAPFVKWAEMDPSAIGFYRCLFAALALAPLALRSKPKTGSWLGKGARLAFISGIVFAMDLIVWHKSILDVGAGVATLLANTQVFWVAIVSAGLLAERLPKQFWLCGFIALLGVAALTLPGLASTRLSPRGVTFGLLAAVFYAGFILTLKASQKPVDALPLTHNLFLSSIGSTLTLGGGSSTVAIAGNLSVAGTTTTVSSTAVEIGDRIIELNTAGASGDAGLYVQDTDTNQTGSLLWDSSAMLGWAV